MAHALIVDDEPDIRELLQITLERMDVQVSLAEDLKQAYAALKDQTFQFCLTDMRLPDGNGIELIRHLNAHHPEIPVAMLTAYGNAESAVEALKAGAFDFVSKPVDLRQLRTMVQTALRLSDQPKHSAPRLRGNSVVMENVRKTVKKLARSQAPVFISGESGVGKELAARMIHELSPRSGGPFVPVNCGAIPTELMESEFFGHKKGAFTGAHSDKTGLFESANGGTIFLDEIADLPLHMQVKLLRVIQDKSVRPIGSNVEHGLDVRILSASHDDLEELVQDSAFRQDLYYRINVIELELPSLRARREDIPELTKFFLEQICQEWNQSVPDVDQGAINALQTYPYPGNVRELRNILERAITLSDGNRITESDLQLKPLKSPPEKTAPLDGEAQNITHDGEQPLEEFIEGIERDAIQKALESTRYNKTAAAKKLGITFRALRYRLKKLGME